MFFHYQDIGKRNYQEDRYFFGITNKISDYKSAFKFLSDFSFDVIEETKGFKNGSTMSIAIITPDKKVVTSNIGDSPMFACLENGTVIPLYEEDSFNNKNKIDALNLYHLKRTVFVDDGFISLSNGSYLAMTRALGDAEFEGNIIRLPHINIHDFSQKVIGNFLGRYKQQKISILVASDGLVERTNKINYIPDTNCTEEMFKQIRDDLIEQNINDNQTLLMTDLITNEAKIMAVFDGHGGSETAEYAKKSFEKRILSL